MNENRVQPLQRREALESELRDTLSADWSLRCYEEVCSTMDVARDVLRDEVDGQPLILMAEYQRSGRGRQGRSWESASTGLYVTFALPGRCNFTGANAFSLAVGTAIHKVLKRFHCELVLKWPNDLLTPQGEKVCGILLENFRKKGQSYMLAGVGLNLFGSPQRLTRSSSVYDITRKRFTPTEMLAHIAPEIRECWELFQRRGFSPFRSYWLKHAALLNEEIGVEVEGNMYWGMMSGIGDTGGLILELGKHRREIYSGHIVSRRDELREQEFAEKNEESVSVGEEK